MFAKFLGESKTLHDIKNQETIIAFLDTRRKNKEEDPEQRWTTTWNDYLWRLKMFYRWLYNVKIKGCNHQNYYNISNWITPDFVNINKKKTKKKVIIIIGTIVGTIIFAFETYVKIISQ